MQDVVAQTPVAYELAHAATAAPDLASQAAAYAAADASIFAATQAAAQQSVATAGELVKSSGEFAVSAGEAALVAAEAAGAAVMAGAVGVGLPLVLGGVGLVGLCGMGYYAWTRKGWTFKGIKESFDQARAEATAPGQWPAWEGYTDEAICNDDALLDALLEPEPSADELEIDWDQLAMECNA